MILVRITNVHYSTLGNMSEMKAQTQDPIIVKQLAELNDTKLFQNDKAKYLGKPMTEEILSDYQESTSWMRANAFVNEERITNKFVLAFIATGGGGTAFDYFFRDKASRLMAFAEMPYLQLVYYKEYINEFREAGVTLLDDDKFYKVVNNQPVSAASETISTILAKGAFNKLGSILDDHPSFEKIIALSLVVDFGSENDKPARLFITFRSETVEKTFGYLFAEKDSREKMNNNIVICLLNILANEINCPDYCYESVELEKFPKRSSELKEEKNQKFFDKLYLLTNM